MGFVTLTNADTGKPELVDSDAVPQLVASKKYLDPGAVAVHRFGEDTYATPDIAEREGVLSPTIDPALAAKAGGHRIRQAENTGVGASLKAVGGGVVSGLTGGLVDPFESEQEFNPLLSGGGQLIGAIAPALVGDEAGLLGLGAKGARIGEDALTAERAAGGLSSKFLFAGRTAGRDATIERSLANGRRAMEAGEAGSAALHAAPDIAGLDLKGLGAAHEAELGSIESARVPQRESLVEDLGAFRRDQSETQKIFLATKDADVKGIGEVRKMSKVSLDADRQLDRLLNNPLKLAENRNGGPLGQALGALQQQENALTRIYKSEPELRAVFAADETGTRAASLDAIPDALEQNKALQQRLRDLSADPMSDRLQAIKDAQASLKMPAAPKSLPEQMLTGAVFGHVTALASPLGPLAPMIGAKASKIVGDLMFGKLGSATGRVAADTKDAIAGFLSVAKRSPMLPVLATRTLANAAFAPADPKAAPAGKELSDLYRARTAEIRSQMTYDQSGKAVMRPEARMAMADQLKAVRPASPLLADRMETVAARKLEYLASVMPKRPEMGGVQFGPDSWHPSDMEMRAFARHVAAVEDPTSVERRLIDGSLTPEDVEAYNAVYPERAALLTQKIMENLGTLQATIPYHRKIALSMLTGMPIDPAMHPQVLAVLQGHFADEPGSDGGTQAPTPQPAFGSVRADIATASQQREGAMK